MKKTLLLLTLTTLSLVNIFAKDISEKKNLYGINGGFGITTMGIEKVNDEAKKRVKIGGFAGFAFEHRFKKVAALEVGVNYTNKGAQQKIEGSDIKRGYYRLNFHSVELPIIFKLYVGKKKIFNVNLGGYASYAFNVQSKVKIVFEDNLADDFNETRNNLLSNDKNPKDADGKRPFRPFDAGVNVGFEFISKKGFGAGARVQQGLVDYTNPKFVFDDDRKVYHTSILFYGIMKF